MCLFNFRSLKFCILFYCNFVISYFYYCSFKKEICFCYSFNASNNVHKIPIALLILLKLKLILFSCFLLIGFFLIWIFFGLLFLFLISYLFRIPPFEELLSSLSSSFLSLTIFLLLYNWCKWYYIDFYSGVNNIILKLMYLEAFFKSFPALRGSALKGRWGACILCKLLFFNLILDLFLILAPLLSFGHFPLKEGKDFNNNFVSRSFFTTTPLTLE